MLPVLFGGSEAIIAQEKAGQRELAVKGRDAQLPENVSKEDRAALEKAGVKFFEMVAGDKLFRHAVLPVGWEIKPTDHDMYSDLLDEHGRKRATIGYKAAFYDRWAQMSACNRFEPGYGKDDWGDPEAQSYACIRDGGKLVWRGKFVGLGYDASTICRDEAVKLLSSLYPDYRDTNAYWDITPTWPESLSSPIPGAEYKWHVSLYHADGRFSDSGSQTPRMAKSDAEALKIIKAMATKSYGGSYKVVAVVTCGERHVGEFTIELPALKVSRNDYFGYNEGRRYGKDCRY